jgi:hypothetical protein
MPDDLKNWWIDSNPGQPISLPSQNHSLKLLSQTPYGLFELFSIQERSKTDGGTLLIRPKLPDNIISPLFTDIIQHNDIHFSIYPNLDDPNYAKVHFSTHATGTSIDFMARIARRFGKMCVPIFGAIYAFPPAEYAYRNKKKHLPHLVASYRPEMCTLTAWLAISQKEEAIAVPIGWATYRYDFTRFSVHFLFSYINCPSSPRTTFFPIFSNEMRLRLDGKEKFIPTLSTNLKVDIANYSALAEDDEKIFSKTMAGNIVFQMAMGSLQHFSRAAEKFEEQNLLIDKKPPREWFLTHCHEFQDVPFDGPNLVSLGP